MDKKPQDTPSRHADKYIVRFPDGMRERIAAAADANGRSMNAEITARLDGSFSAPSDPNTVAAIARLAISLAQKDIEKLTEQMRTAALARHVRFLGERMLSETDESDAALRSEINAALEEAAEFYHSPRDLTNDMVEKAAAMQSALEHIEQIAGAEQGSPELQRLLNAIQAVRRFAGR